MKRMIACLLVLVVLAGCSSDNREDTPRITGTEAVEFSVVNAPREVFEGEEFSITYSLENVGGVDITELSPGILSFSANRLYLLEQGRTDRFDSQHFWLEGRTPFVDGGGAFVTAYFQAREIDRSSQEVNTGVLASICYPYMSQISSQVCLETSRDADPGSIICRNTPVVPSTPGAPIIVDKIETRTARSANQLLPTFRLNIRNAGDGIPSTGACTGYGSDNLEGLNQVYVSASLLDEQLECVGSGENGSVSLTRGRGLVTCSVPDFSSLEFGNSVANYLSVLSINISYSYRDSVRSDIRIVR